MNASIVVDAAEYAQLKRKVMYAKAGCLISQIISFGAGFVIAANWPMIVARFA